MHLHPAIPDDLRNRFWYLLQPGLVRATSVIQENMRKGSKSEASLRRGLELNLLPQHRRVELEIGRFGFVECAARTKRLTPKLSRIGVGGNFALKLLPS